VRSFAFTTLAMSYSALARPAAPSILRIGRICVSKYWFVLVNHRQYQLVFQPPANWNTDCSYTRTVLCSTVFVTM